MVASAAHTQSPPKETRQPSDTLYTIPMRRAAPEPLYPPTCSSPSSKRRRSVPCTPLSLQPPYSPVVSDTVQRIRGASVRAGDEGAEMRVCGLKFSGRGEGSGWSLGGCKGEGVDGSGRRR